VSLTKELVSINGHIEEMHSDWTYCLLFFCVYHTVFFIALGFKMLLCHLKVTMSSH